MRWESEALHDQNLGTILLFGVCADSVGYVSVAIELKLAMIVNRISLNLRELFPTPNVLADVDGDGIGLSVGNVLWLHSDLSHV